MKRCPHCGTENADQHEYCIACGKEIAPLAPDDASGPIGSLPEGPVSIGAGDDNLPPPSSPPPAVPEASVSPQAPPPAPPEQPLPPVEPPRAAVPPPVVPPPMPGAYMLPPAQQSPQALWSLILGIASIVCCGLIGPVAIYLGVQARKETGPNQGMATAGMVLGIIGTIITGLMIIFYALMFAIGLSTGG